MKRLFLIVLVILSMNINCYAQQISPWALNDYKQMSSYGLLDREIVKGNFQKNITRLEFSKLIMNIYSTQKKVEVDNSMLNTFSDTDDISVLKAYKTGIVKGKENNLFKPDDFITRQEMGVMISRLLGSFSDSFSYFDGQITSYFKKFNDSAMTADWAVKSMAAVCNYDIIKGTDGNVFPLNYATREQAVCMLNRVYNEFVEYKDIYKRPDINYIDKNLLQFNTISIAWYPVGNVKNYNVIIKSDNAEPMIVKVHSSMSSLEDYSLPVNFKAGSIIIEAELNNGIKVFSEPYELIINNTPPVLNEQTLDKIEEERKKNTTETKPVVKEPQRPVISVDNNSDNKKTENKNGKKAQTQKELRVFPDGYYFETKEEASAHMREVQVPVWHLNKDGTKSSSEKYITVNENLADDVVSIFTEIYNDPSQFPIKDVGGFSWRCTSSGRLSHHSYGTCIDINANENYFVDTDGTPIVGSYWKPGEDPYSIGPDSIVVRTFAKYGWEWGATAWSEKYAKDYMHFTYLGK